MKRSLQKLLRPSAELSPLPTGVKASGEPLDGIKAVVFDIYGTLLISGSGDVGTAIEAGSADAFRLGLEKAGVAGMDRRTAESVKSLFFRLIDQSHLASRREGIPWPEVDIIKIWTGIIEATPELSGLKPEIAAAAYESIANPVAPMPGAPEILDSLRKRGLKLGIISNAQFYTPLILEMMFGNDLDTLGFSSKLCFFSYLEKRSKPDTALFESLTRELEKNGMTPAETVFIGNDMLKDIMPAAESGYKTVLFAGDKRSLRLRKDHDACRNIKADVIVNKLIELADYIK